MPTLISDLDSQQAWDIARMAAEDYGKSPIQRLSVPEHQGCFSRTYLAEFEDKTGAIIQLKDNHIDTAMVGLARGLLGDIVPSVQAVRSGDAMHAYAQPFIHGSRWDPLVETSLEDDVAISNQLGSILSRCMTTMKSESIVDNYIIPRLHHILENDLSDQLRDRIRSLLNRIANLKRLPLMVCHIDPNPFNIILDESHPPNIIGLIDWEGVTFLPFGMNAYQIRLIAVINRQRVDCPDPKSATPIALAFWESLTAHIPEDLKGSVLDAMCTGLILFCEFNEGQGVPTAKMLQNAVARWDWLEEMYRPLCGS